jgi:type II restriction enzyme
LANRLLFNPELAAPYSSASQRVRVLSEHWTHEHLYCPNCGEQPLRKTENNRPASDFSCCRCAEVFELKSKRGAFDRKLTDGAYDSLMRRLAERNSPSLFLLSYRGQPPEVTTFTIVPKHFLTPSLVERRRPLAPTAQRAGWIGCNILLEGIPQVGRILLYEAGVFRSKEEVRAAWQRTTFLREQEHVEGQGWLIHVMRAIESLGQGTFRLTDLYRLEGWFRSLYPQNAHIRPKIRQQLQRLRDVGYLEFLGGGAYRLRRDNAAVQSFYGVA